MRIARKEAKETVYWLRLIESEDEGEKERLIAEATEIMKIMSAIIQKSE